MSQFFLKIRSLTYLQKILLILLIPTITLTYFSIDGFIEKTRAYLEVETLDLSARLAFASSALIHEIQAERGLSAGYLGSQGQKFIHELTLQYTQTDLQFRHFDHFIQEIDLAHLQLEQTVVDQFFSQMKQITTTRTQVRSFQKTMSETIAYYFDLNHQLINFAMTNAHLGLYPKISNQLVAYTYFMHAKESVGLERALLSHVFAAGSLSDESYIQLLGLFNEQKTYLDTFFKFSNYDQSGYAAKMSHPMITEITTIRKLALENSFNKTDPLHWFQLMTIKINLLRDIEKEISLTIETLIKQFKHAARFELMRFVIILAGIIVIAWIITILIMKHLNAEHEYMLRTQEDLLLAAQLQRSTMRSLTTLPFLKTTVKFLPLMEVSGDIFDESLNDHGDFNVFLGDVSGHGVPAALISMMLKVMLFSIGPNRPVHEIMSELDYKLVPCLPDEKFVTGVYLRITSQGQLTTCVAGHPPPLILPANGQPVIKIQEGGTIIGIPQYPKERYQKQAHYQLSRGDRVFIYSDGLVECAMEKIPFGIKRLIQFLEEHRDLETGLLLDSLLEHVTAFLEGEEFKDDITLLGLEYRGSLEST